MSDAEWLLLYQEAVHSLGLFVVGFQAAVLLNASVARSGDVWSSIDVLASVSSREARGGVDIGGEDCISSIAVGNY